MKGLFDFLNSINDHVYTPPEDGDDYNQFMINKGLSYYPDTILLVNEINKAGFSNKSHYDFLFYTVDKRKRRSKWFKAEKDEQVQLLCDYFTVSVNKAREMVKFFSPEDFENIKTTLHKGG